MPIKEGQCCRLWNQTSAKYFNRKNNTQCNLQPRNGFTWQSYNYMIIDISGIVKTFSSLLHTVYDFYNHTTQCTQIEDLW